MLQALLQNVRNEIENRNNKIIIIIYVEVDILSCRIKTYFYRMFILKMSNMILS